MPNPKPEPDWGSAWDKPEPDWEQELQHPQAQRGEVREEIAARFNFGWRSRFESLPGYMPEAIQSDYALKMARQRQESLPGYISEEINAAMPPEWHWKNQHDTWNLDEEGKPLNQFGDSLPYGAVEWTPMGNPSYRLEGQSVFQGEWNKFVSILNAPYGYGESLWEDNRYKTGPEPTAFTDEEIQSKLEEGSIDVAQAHEMRLLVRQEREWWAKRFEKMTERVTGEPPSMGTQLGRLPGAAIKFIFGVAQIPAYGTERRLGAMNDLIATAQKDLGIHMPYERYAPEEHPEWVQNHPVTVFREEQYSNEREYWEEYFKDPAVHTLESYFRESYVDSSLAKVLGTNLALGVGVHNKNIVKGGPLDRSLDSARIKYTGIKAPQQRAEYLKRLRDGEDPEALAEELGDVWAEGIGRSVIDPLWLTDIAAHNLRDVFRWTSYAKKFLGSNEFVPKAIAAIKEVGKIVPEQMTDDVYKVASATLGIDNKSSLFRFRNFMDSQGFFALTSPGKQNRMTQMAGEVIASITRVAGDAQKQGDAFKAIVLMASDVDAERKMGLILASNFQSPKMLFSEAARNVGFLIREMYRGADGVVDANRYLKNLSVAQALGEDAVSRFVGKGLDKAIDALYPSMFERILAHDTAVAWADEGLELSQQMFDALGDNIPKYIRAAVKFDAGLPGDIKRGINTFFAYAYMGFGPGWFSRNIQNNVLTSVVDQGIAGMKYWTADGALANASAWMGQIDVAGFGPRTKMGITELKHYSSIELPDDVRKIANQVGEIQAKLDKLPKSKYVPGKDAYEEAQKLKKAIKGLDLQLGKAMKDHKLLDKASGIPSLFGPADKAERMTGANVLSAAGERAMRKQMKVGRALPEGKVLFDAELPEDVFKLFVSDIVESKGDVAGAISRLKKAITTGESPWVLSGTSFIPDKVNKQLIDHRFMQHYVDIIRDGFIKGENIEPVLTKWRAVTAGWDEMAAKVSDDVVTLADDVEGAETIIRTVSENLKAGIMDE